MKKAFFVSMEKKNELQVLEDISLTPQQRVWRMFELMEALSFLKKEKPVEITEGMVCITLKRKNADGQLSQRFR